MLKEILTVICVALVISGIVGFLAPSGKMNKTIKLVITVIIFFSVLINVNGFEGLFSCDKSYKNQLLIDTSSIEESVLSKYSEKYNSVVENYVAELLSKNNIEYRTIDVISETSDNSVVIVKYVYIELINEKDIFPDSIKRKIEEYAGVECLLSVKGDANED